jgi:hypothetical protein
MLPELQHPSSFTEIHQYKFSTVQSLNTQRCLISYVALFDFTNENFKPYFRFYVIIDGKKFYLAQQ